MSKLDFSYLISPHSNEDFLADYWQKSSLLIRADEPSRFHALLPATNVDAVIALADGFPSEAIELIGKSSAISQQRSEPGALKHFFDQGSTIRVRGIEKYSEPLRELCRSIELELGFPTRANLYCTPSGTRGFDLHFDTHEVLILQLLGKKQWQVYESNPKLPLEYVPPLPFESDREALKRARGGRVAGQDGINEAELGPLTLNESLEPGDVLYLPRGFVHQAQSLDQPSIHLTIGIHVFTWLDLLSVALGRSAHKHESFRQALPVGWFEDSGVRKVLAADFDLQLQRFRQDADCENALDELVESLTRSRAAELSQPAAGGLDRETRLEGKGPLQVYLSQDGSTAGLALGPKVFWMPASFALAFRFVAERKSFCVHELPAQLTDVGKVNLARRLVVDEFLRIVD